MLDILLNIGVFFIAVIAHAAWCRHAKSKDLQIRAFLLLAIGFLCVTIAIEAMTAQPGSDAGVATIWSMPLKFTSALIYLLLTMLYLICYINTRVESPSQRMLRICSRANGASIEDLAKAVNDNDFIMTRMSDLTATGYVEAVGDERRLLPKGLFLAQILACYHKISGREMGG